MLDYVLDEALSLHALGYSVIPLKPGTKQASIRWKRYQRERPGEADLRTWFAKAPPNLAVVCGPVIVVDCDSPEVLDLVGQHCTTTPMICQTPRGGRHLYFRARKGIAVGNRVAIKGQPIDLRAQGGYAVAPPSRGAEGIAYRWLGEPVPIGELPLFTVAWTRQRTRTRRVGPVSANDPDGLLVRRARAYLACIEGAIAGRRGHDRTFRAACVLIRKFSLSIEQAFPLLLEWNETCEPPWSEKELLHKLEDAAGRKRRSR